MSTEIEDIMVRNVKTADLGKSVLEAADMMNHYDIGCVVVTENGKPVGVITERDILKKVVSKRRDPSTTKLHEVMSKPLITAKPHATITSVARMMIKNKIKKLPITSSDELLGILSLTDLMPLLKKQKTANRFSLNDAPQRIKRVFDACIDPETQLRRRCPLIVMGDMATVCMGTRCMWFDNGGCVFQSFVHQLLERQPNHKR